MHNTDKLFLSFKSRNSLHVNLCQKDDWYILTSSAGIESLQVTKLNFGLLFHLTEKKVKV